MSRARDIYEQSDGKVTKAYYHELQNGRGPAGMIAMNLFRAHKASSRAKGYRGSYIGQAYEKKEWSLGLLVNSLISHSEKLGIKYGWKEDRKTIVAGSRGAWILYIDLPTGQVSFHTKTRGLGPEYRGEWDGAPLSDVRIIRYCDNLMGEEPEDLKSLLDLEAVKPLHGRVLNQEHRRAKMEGKERRIEAIKMEMRRWAGEEVQHIERQAQMVQAEMF